MMTKAEIVAQILNGRGRAPAAGGYAFAPSNIALCKYWGKRDEELNLPVTASLSISLGRLGSTTKLSLRPDSDVVRLDKKELAPDSPFARRIGAFLDLFRRDAGMYFEVEAVNTIPTAAGFASSASGFAALVTALDELFGWELDKRELSILARLGSGSACRSLHHGFVEWRAGTRPDGMDSYGERLDAAWPELRLGLLVITAAEKSMGSRPAMKRTIETCALYKSWPEKAAADLALLKKAIAEKDFHLLGATAESNALAMHATMIASWPPVVYWRPESLAAMQAIWAARANAVPVYFTMDAGPNLKLIFQAGDEAAVRGVFPDLKVVRPFDAEP
jgi:diphosphomevalonate decarboxylase